MSNLSSSHSGLALLLTVLAMLVFAFFAFMGTEYLCDGDHMRVALFCLPAFLILGCFVWLAQRIKLGRKKNTALEITSLVGALCIVLVGMVPFSQFVYTIEHEAEINQLVEDSRDAAMSIDSLYENYANERVADYKRYNNNKATKKTRSLHRRLFPEDRDSIVQQRAGWLATLHTIDLWNVATARNLHHIITASEQWTEQYAEVSAIIYQGEQSEPFSVDNSDIRERYAQFTTFHWPLTRWSVIAGLVCSVLMSVSYIVCTRSRNKSQGNRA